MIPAQAKTSVTAFIMADGCICEKEWSQETRKHNQGLTEVP
jgi:hypothetical protein